MSCFSKNIRKYIMEIVYDENVDKRSDHTCVCYVGVGPCSRGISYRITGTGAKMVRGRNFFLKELVEEELRVWIRLS